MVLLFLPIGRGERGRGGGGGGGRGRRGGGEEGREVREVEERKKPGDVNFEGVFLAIFWAYSFIALREGYFKINK